MDCLKRIKDLLSERNWTMYQLSQRAKIPQSTLSNLFIRNNAPTIQTLEKICEAFGITMTEFFGGEASLPMEENELLSEFRRLPKETKLAVIELLKQYPKK
ncbi:MAG: helix-turn-helix transcriptional regulator [Clostridia bacterium]|nr:helix-turn-helix transcriptional regulator [Clostridia bacterium]